MSDLELNEGGEGGGDDAVQAEARREGWKPKEEYNGPEENWVDAETFVRRGREINPILKKNNSRLQAELASLRAELGETKNSLKQVQEYHTELEKKAYERAYKTLKAELKSARREGDPDMVEELEEQLDNLKEQDPTKKAPPPPAPPPNADDPMKNPVFAEWAGENPWFTGGDEDMIDYANGVGARLQRQGLKGRPFLDKITEAVQKQFPDKFKGGNKGKPSLVEPGGNGGTGGSGGSGGRSVSIRSLPADAQQAYRDLSKEKWYQDLAKSQKLTTEQLYVKDYQGE